MLKTLKFIQYVWVAVGAISAFKAFQLWGQPGEGPWIFGGFAVVSLIMFFVRKRQVEAYEKRQSEKEQS